MPAKPAASVALLALAALLLPGCAQGLGGWVETTEGPYRLHVVARDAYLFSSLPATLAAVDAELNRSLGPLHGPIDLYAYGPDPPPGTPEAPFFRSHATSDHKSVYLAAWPPGLAGSPAGPAALRGVLLHELVHIHQHQLAAVKLPRWLVEGGATLAQYPRPGLWSKPVVRAARQLATAAPGAPSFDAAFDAVPPAEQDNAIHAGGALALAYLAGRCSLGDSPWEPLAQGLAAGASVGATLADRCGAPEPDLLRSWPGWLEETAARLEAGFPAAPVGEVVATLDAGHVARDGCGAGDAGWLVVTDSYHSQLLRVPGQRDLTPERLFPLSVACRGDGGALVLGTRPDGRSEADLLDAAGTLEASRVVPHPVGALALDAAHARAYYWAQEGSAAPVLERLTLPGLEATAAGNAPTTSRLVFSPDGARVAYGTAGNGTVRAWAADATDPLAAPHSLGPGTPAAWDGAALWASQRGTAFGSTQLVQALGPRAGVVAERYYGSPPFGAPPWLLANTYDVAEGASVLVALEFPPRADIS